MRFRTIIRRELGLSLEPNTFVDNFDRLGVGAVLLFVTIFSRLESIGYYHHWWKLQDVRMCKTYWNLAPKAGLVAVAACRGGDVAGGSVCYVFYYDLTCAIISQK